MTSTDLDTYIRPFSIPFDVFGWTLLGAAVWFVLCKLLRRSADRAWSLQMRSLDASAGSATNLDAKLGHLVIARSYAGRGAPSERLFFIGIVVMSLACLLAVPLILMRG